MKPSDIIVGKHYVHPSFPNYRFLGAGNSDTEASIYPFNIVFKEKFLVVVEDEEAGFVGGIVKDPEFCAPGYWDGFQLLEKSLH